MVFSRDGLRPFDPSNELRSVRRVWGAVGLPGLGFHQCRHAYASLMIAAGVNAKALCAYMGHSSILVTLDRYGHLFPWERAHSCLTARSVS
jgi:integrase